MLLVSLDDMIDMTMMSRGSPAPGLLLAHKWEESQDPAGWWISEKLDGVRKSCFYD
jgi:hypothetical protein